MHSVSLSLSLLLAALLVTPALSLPFSFGGHPFSLPSTWLPKPLPSYKFPFFFPSPPGGPFPPKSPLPPPKNTFSAAAAAFYVNSSALPLINFPLPPSYAGLLPITADKGEERKLFFWYWPSTASGGSNSLTIWLNGGPGCSSLTGFLMENGPISFRTTLAPILNPYGWTTTTDMLWIDQPLGTGYSAGGPANDITTMPELAEQFYGFLTQFYATFPPLIQKPLTLAGESYSGKYIPYIAQRILDASSAEQKATPIQLNSLLMSDGTYSDFAVPQQLPAATYAATYQSELMLSDSVVATLANLSAACGYDAVLAQALTYPPTSGPVYIPAGAEESESCDLWDYMLGSSQNPCLSPYDVEATCALEAVEPDNTPMYFSRLDVQALLNVPNLGTFEECSSNSPFNTASGYDTSPYSETLLPSLTSLPHGVTMWHGLRDALLIHTGDRVTIQNMTWAGKQGFQTGPSGWSTLEVAGQNQGVWHEERGLTYIEVTNAGHLIPYNQPQTALMVLEYALGKGSL